MSWLTMISAYRSQGQRFATVSVSWARPRKDELVDDGIRTLTIGIETCNSEYLGGSNDLFRIFACLHLHYIFSL
jgi:hypothetical protein